MKRTPLRRTTKPRRKSKHTLLIEEARSRYDELVDAQAKALGWKKGEERCAICLREPKSRRLDIDHDHKLFVVRGLLCPRDNRALPYWITSEWLGAAKDYLNNPPLAIMKYDNIQEVPI